MWCAGFLTSLTAGVTAEARRLSLEAAGEMVENATGGMLGADLLQGGEEDADHEDLEEPEKATGDDDDDADKKVAKKEKSNKTESKKVAKTEKKSEQTAAKKGQELEKTKPEGKKGGVGPVPKSASRAPLPALNPGPPINHHACHGSHTPWQDSSRDSQGDSRKGQPTRWRKRERAWSGLG
eukprot:2198145-Rhodomonas_salina.1